MKRLITWGMTVALAMCAPVLFAAEAPAVTGAQAKKAAPGTAEFDKQIAQMQENMKKMQEQMDKIRQTQDPEARQKLLQDHRATMQHNMQLMHGMWGQGMMGCCAGGPMMGQGMMEQCMPMQQMMMDHMMQHNQWMWQQPQAK